MMIIQKVLQFLQKLYGPNNGSTRGSTDGHTNGYTHSLKCEKNSLLIRKYKHQRVSQDLKHYLAKAFFEAKMCVKNKG